MEAAVPDTTTLRTLAVGVNLTTLLQGIRISVMPEGKDAPESQPSKLPSGEVPRSLGSRVSDEDMLRFFAKFQRKFIPSIILVVTVWGIYADAAFNFYLVTNGPWLIISSIAFGSAIISSAFFYLSGRLILSGRCSPFTIIFSVFVLWVCGPLMAYANWTAEMQVKESYIRESELNISLWPSLVWAAFSTCILLGTPGIRNKYFRKPPESRVEAHQTDTPDE